MIRDLHPNYFAVVMATGIISNDFQSQGNQILSNTFFYAGVVAWSVLVAFFLLRVIFCTEEFRGDLTDARFMFTFFTFAAGTSVLGVHLAAGHQVLYASIFWVVTFAVWLPLTYLTLSVLILRNVKPIEMVMNGGWFLLIVGTESLSILSSYLATDFQAYTLLASFFSYGVWSAGLILYLVFVALIVYRLAFFPVSAADLSPPYWIIMGAAAITTVAGTILSQNLMNSQLLPQLNGFLQGTSVSLWGWETWWLPLLVFLGFWRHFLKKYSLKYDPTMWSMVFVLGMYTKASWNVGGMLGIVGLQTFASDFVWVAVAAWVFVLINMAVYPKAR